MFGCEPGIALAVLAVIYLAFKLWNLRRPALDVMVRCLAGGQCLRCGAVHPEALKRLDPKGFWTEFRCPECGGTLTTHLH